MSKNSERVEPDTLAYFLDTDIIIVLDRHPTEQRCPVLFFLYD